MKTQLVVLVHGYCKNSDDMAFLNNGLKNRNYDTFSATLPTTFGTIEDCTNSLRIQIEDLLCRYEQVHFIGHSMGGLIIQRYLSTTVLNNIGKCIFVATPNKGSKLATICS
ncbi:alpha/beta fold hydrolase, partial [Desulfococcaceae bacterium HSG8]|nr:alpha/beta fold hydrolase [Desulfococcaceae bacterium HSG8]